MSYKRAAATVMGALIGDDLAGWSTLISRRRPSWAGVKSAAKLPPDRDRRIQTNYKEPIAHFKLILHPKLRHPNRAILKTIRARSAKNRSLNKFNAPAESLGSELCLLVL
jgi:hypothetical protein